MHCAKLHYTCARSLICISATARERSGKGEPSKPVYTVSQALSLLAMKRAHEPSAWEACVAWVVACGGEVRGITEGSSGVRGVVVADESLVKDEVVLKIPLSCCVLREDVTRSAVGRAARDAVAAGECLVMPEKDVALAFFVARDASDASSARAPYYATLPRAGDAAFPDLPRYWPAAHVDALLAGSPVRGRVELMRRITRCDYDTIVATGSGDWPTFEAYDWACAMVATRSFALADGLDALVPLADMLNHSRDRETAYGAYGAFAVWTATRNMASGLEVHDTYGAKSNAVLLANYGFALVANFEADGSCNEERRIELPAARDGRVDLRMGRKADVLRTFAACVDAMRAAANAAAPPPDDDDAGDFPAGDFPFDDDGDESDGDDEESDDGEDEEAKRRALWARRLPVEIDALSALAARLARECRGYALRDPVAVLRGAPPPTPPATDEATWRARVAACAALVLNEFATLCLNELVAWRCLEVLRAPDDQAARLVAALRLDAAATATPPADDVAKVENASSRASAAPAALGYLQLIGCPCVAERD